MDKQHIIYKITNTLNDRFYVGMHTGYPDDGYLGSGKRIKAEIKKYGKENFKKEILEVIPDRKSLELREAEIVNDQLLADPLCLNLKNGGSGQWPPMTEELKSAISRSKKGKPVPKLTEAMRLARERAKEKGTTVGGCWPTKTWKIRLPDSSTIEITNLKRWCEQQNIHIDLVRRTLVTGKPLSRGKHKGLHALSST